MWAIIDFIYFVRREYLGKRRKSVEAIAFYIFFGQTSFVTGKTFEPIRMGGVQLSKTLMVRILTMEHNTMAHSVAFSPSFLWTCTNFDRPHLIETSRHFPIYNTSEQSDYKTCFFGPESLYLFVDTLPHLVTYILCPLENMLSNCQPASPPPAMEYKNNILCEPFFVNGVLYALLDMASAANPHDTIWLSAVTYRLSFPFAIECYDCSQSHTCYFYLQWSVVSTLIPSWFFFLQLPTFTFIITFDRSWHRKRRMKSRFLMTL